MIPPEVERRMKSRAEEKLFNRLRSLEVNGLDIALHSVNLAEHEFKVLGEIDFLLLGRAGLFALEVKGGRVSCHEGIWTFTDRYDVARRKRESPFEQARTALFSLRDRLKELVGPALVDRAPFGYAVVFPDQHFDKKSVEWADEMVLDVAGLDVHGGLGRFLRRLPQYWGAKERHSAALTDEEIGSLLSGLRPEFDIVPTLRHRTDEVERDVARLTARQYHLLDFVEDNPRLVCQGGAGTGKTLLAAEVARREAFAGRSVLVTCVSSTLSALLTEQLDDPLISVAPFAAFKHVAPPVVDTLVVDEAQDLVNPEDLDVLDGLIRGGLALGRWRLFCDTNNQIGLVGRFEHASLDRLRDLGGVLFNLRDNCRNTRNIMERTTELTGADVGVTSAGYGPEVQIAWWTDAEDAAQLLAGHLDRLAAEGIDPSEITLLSPKPLHNSSVAKLPIAWRTKLAPLAPGGTVLISPGHVVFATVSDFKGLENRFVALTDVDDLSSPSGRTTLYTGMTRARAGLWIGVEASQRALVPLGRRSASGTETVNA
jgi:hypothetical protein